MKIPEPITFSVITVFKSETDVEYTERSNAIYSVKSGTTWQEFIDSTNYVYLFCADNIVTNYTAQILFLRGTPNYPILCTDPILENGVYYSDVSNSM